MRYSQVFPKTLREAPREAATANHKFLVRAGFIDQLMAGSWTLLPLGWRVVSKITRIIREEMNSIGCQEMLMPLLHPKEIWNQTGRWEEADEIMFKIQDSRSNKSYALSFTHEEIVMDLARKFVQSYKDLPLNVYHFSTKFRNELRPQGGILRGREFLMKDAYSLHTSEGDLMEWYEKYKQAYLKIYERFGVKVYYTEAAGGVFTEKHTHEFQLEAEAGEDTIYVKPGSREAINKEIFTGDEKDYEVKRAIEVGNIFPLGKKYSEKMGAMFTDQDGVKKPIWFGSYGIGTTRNMGAIVEASHDEKGIIWPAAVAPFQAHLVDLAPLRPSTSLGATLGAEAIYRRLTDAGIEVLWDDRDVSAGQKFADADLIGVPVRLVVSEKAGDKIEWKRRDDTRTVLLSIEEVVRKVVS